MGKYDPLRRFLESAAPGISEVILSFRQIEQILDDTLPYTAKHTGAWWANELRSSTKPQSSSWIEAGWEVGEVDRVREWVRFRRMQRGRRFGDKNAP
jgi:hypothetical protein